jgi:hypothetical protein
MPARLISFEQPWRSVSFAERWALDAVTAILWPLDLDQRITVLTNLMAAQIDNQDQIDAIGDMLTQNLDGSQRS